jgi:GTPase SAR1 family protein
VDAVIFVFSLENEASFNAIYAYYTKMSHYRNAAEVPIILVGTQGEFHPIQYVRLTIQLASRSCSIVHIWFPLSHRKPDGYVDFMLMDPARR